MLPKNVWQIKGKNSGLNITVFGGVHGDELVGIEVIKKLKELFGLAGQPDGIYENEEINGNIFLVFGNPLAIERGTRAAGTGLDMNRMFGPKKLDAEPSSDDQPDLIRARELAPILAKADIHLDIHCTSSPSLPFIITTKADLNKLQNISKYTGAKYILLDPNNVYAAFLGIESNYATDDYVNNCAGRGGVGLCYETGYEKDVSLADGVYKEVINILKYAGALSERFILKVNEFLSDRENSQKIYMLKKAVLAEDDSFKYEPGMNMGWQEVNAGRLVGTYGNGRKVFIEEAGMFLFPKGENKIKKGDSLYYLAGPYQEVEKKP